MSFAANASARAAYEPAESAFSAFATPTNIGVSVVVLFATLLVLEQANYRAKKGCLPGAAWTIPVIGRFFDSLNPTLENYKKGWAQGPLSVTSVFHIFIVLASDNFFARKILTSPTYAEPCLVASAKQVLCADNWVFLGGKAHVDYRKGLNTLFTRRSLAIYLSIQERIYSKYFDRWLSDPTTTAQPMMFKFRDLNMETSLRVFCGEYLPQHAADQISSEFWLITVALELVNFPIPLPGTKVWNAIQARKRMMKWLMFAAAESKKAMAAGGEVTCLTDAWIKNMIEARRDSEGETEELSRSSRQALTREFNDREIAMTVLSFLFASQDAMSSALIYLFQHMADQPELLRKVREEQYRLRGDDLDAPITYDLLEQMDYTRWVVKESMRVAPPVIMVPYLTKKPFPMSDAYTAPKGAMVIPSFWNSLHDEEIYPAAEKIVPERWDPANGGDDKDMTRNYLVFGAGVHNCIGQQYAVMHLTAVLGAASVKMNWHHEKTPESDQVKIIATIFPKDDCHLKFTKRASPPIGTAPEVAALP